jgi:two-component system copper resistance phosphate regulon response regulator CusR
VKVLVVEDELKTASFLKKGLTENGFIVDCAENGQEGFFLALTEHYDVIILDVMLPKLDGFGVVTGIRQKHPHVPILFLTARDTLQDKVKGLELGADDYLVKPFAFIELLARVRSLLRRGEVCKTAVLQIEDLYIDTMRYRATRNGQRLDLTQKEFSLLLLFAKHQGHVLSRTLIAEQVWDMNFDSDLNTIDVAVRRLRRKLDDPFSEKLIHTIRGVGYVLEKR